MKHRQAIIHSFARWAAASATRQGCPVRGKELYEYLDAVPLNETLVGDCSITAEEFSVWHRRAVEDLAVRPKYRPIGIGWAAKLINLLLKVRAYLGSEGRPGLSEYLHPPIDNSLIQTIRTKYLRQHHEGKANETIRKKISKFHTIVGIQTYDTYAEIIDGLREISVREECLLCEVEYLWPG